MSNQGALATLNDDAAIAELASGTLLRQIAQRFDCSKIAVYKRLSKHPDYPEAVRQQATSLVEQATQEVFECDSETVNIARARVDAAHKWAAARDPERWAGKAVQINIGAVLNLDPASVSSIGSLLDRAASQQSEEKIIDSSDQQS